MITLHCMMACFTNELVQACNFAVMSQPADSTTACKVETTKLILLLRCCKQLDSKVVWVGQAKVADPPDQEDIE